MELRCILCDSMNWEEGNTELDYNNGIHFLEGTCNKCGTKFKMKFNCIHMSLIKQGKKIGDGEQNGKK